MPTWSEELAESFPDAPELRTESSYRGWLLRLAGIWGDPISARRAYDAAVASGVRGANRYTYRQALRNAMPRGDIDQLHDVLRHSWGTLPITAGPTADAGSVH